jgi:hypothetical protein
VDDDVIECPGCGILLLATEPSCPKCGQPLAAGLKAGGKDAGPKPVDRPSSVMPADPDEIAALDAEIAALQRGILLRKVLPWLGWLTVAVLLALYVLGWL